MQSHALLLQQLLHLIQLFRKPQHMIVVAAMSTMHCNDKQTKIAHRSLHYAWHKRFEFSKAAHCNVSAVNLWHSVL